MNKKPIFGIALGCATAAVVVAAAKRSAGPRPRMWEKMRERMEAMPDDFPPRVMFDNVAATRVNSERILELLEKQRGPSGAGAPPDDIPST